MANLNEAYHRAKATRDPCKRGREFEGLLARLFDDQGFSVHMNPRTSHPRQTDMIAEADGLAVLVEAKWKKRKVGTPDIDSLRTRLRRVPHDIVGAIFSMSGYTASAIREVEADRSREILLFAPHEIEAMFLRGTSLHELLRMKRESFRHQASVWFDTLSTSSEKRLPLRETQAVFQMGSSDVDHIVCRSSDASVLFARNIHEIAYMSPNGQSVALELRLMLNDYSDLEHFLAKIDQIFGLSNEGSYCIHQTSISWFGFGAAGFIRQIQNWKERYEHDGVEALHHSEDIAYFDRLAEGWIAIGTQHHIGNTRGQRFSLAECEIQLSGIPLDMKDYRRVCFETNNADARFVHASSHNSCSIRLSKRLPLRVKGHIVNGDVTSDTTDPPSVTGLVVDNPFYKTQDLLKDLASSTSCPLNVLTEVEYLVCYLSDWLDYGDVVDHYYLRTIDACWAGHHLTVMPSCTWNRLLKRIRPADTEPSFDALIDKELRTEKRGS